MMSFEWWRTDSGSVRKRKNRFVIADTPRTCDRIVATARARLRSTATAKQAFVVPCLPRGGWRSKKRARARWTRR